MLDINNGETFEFKAKIVNQLYYNDNSSYGVYKFCTRNDIPHLNEDSRGNKVGFSTTDEVLGFGTLLGITQQLYIGTWYDVKAKLSYSNKYKNYQYEIVNVIPVMPSSENEQIDFLSAFTTKQRAKAIVEAYPNFVSDVKNNSKIIDISAIRGVGIATFQKIKKAVIDNYMFSDLIAWLSPYGISLKAIKDISEQQETSQVIKERIIENPYILTKIKGFGFMRVDIIALKINPDIRVSKHRTNACVKYLLTKCAEEDGNTYVYEKSLKNKVFEVIPECKDIYLNIIEEQTQKTLENKNENWLVVDNGRVALKSYYRLEENILNKLRLINYSPLEIVNKKLCNKENQTKLLSLVIKDCESEQGFRFSEEQVKIIKQTISSKVSIISGKAGTGKTTISKPILKYFKELGLKISCCALSAKASQRIVEATGFSSSTIHRLLLPLTSKSGGKDSKMDDMISSEVNSGNSSVKYLPCNVLFIDECSMINAEIFGWILKHIDPEDTIVIMCGDNKQLPPIGSGNVFSDLLLYTNLFNVHQLKKVHRQAELSGILSDANKIREGINPLQFPASQIVTGELKDMCYKFKIGETAKEQLNELAIKAYMQAVKSSDNGVDDTVLLIPRKDNAVNCTNHLNQQIQDLIIPYSNITAKTGSIIFKKGAKVIQRINNYEKNVMNGEIGYITNITADGIVTVQYKDINDNSLKYIEYQRTELIQINLAYAVTVHLSQGSGYNNVVCIIDNSSFVLLDNCLLYTALTRAKKKCMLLCEPSAYNKCIKTSKNTSRTTWLSLKQF